MPDGGALEFVIRVHGTAASAADIEVVKHAFDDLGDSAQKSGRKARESEAAYRRLEAGLVRISRRMGPIATALVAFGPAVVPAVAVATAAVGGLAAAFAPAAAGAIGFGMIFKSQMKDVALAAKQITVAQAHLAALRANPTATPAQIASAQQHLEVLRSQSAAQLGPGGAQSLAAVTTLQSTWQAFRASFAPQMNGLLAIAANAANRAIPLLRPLIAGAASAFTTLAHQASATLSGPGVRTFVDYLTRNVKPAILTAGAVLRNFGAGLFGLMRNLEPLGNGMRGWILGVSEAFKRWGTDTRTANTFMRFVHQEGPMIRSTLSNMAQALSDAGPSLMIMGNSSLLLLQALGKVTAFAMRIPVFGPALAAAIPFLAIGLKIVPMVKALRDAWIAFQLVAKAQAIWAVVTALYAMAAAEGVAATAMWILDAAMFANPIGLMTVLFWAFVAATTVGAILIIKHWDSVKAAMAHVWGWMKNVARNTANAVKGAFIGAINWVIRAWDSLHFRLPHINLGPLGTFGGNTISVPQIGQIGTAHTVPQRVAPARGGGGGIFGAPQPITLTVDGQVLARAMHRQTQSQQARGG